MRRDIIYEDKTHGGLGMTSLASLYDVNRCRIFSQIFEAGKRLEGRQQVSWASQILIEEVLSPNPCMMIYTKNYKIY